MTRPQLQHRRAVAKTALVPLAVAAERLGWKRYSLREYVRSQPHYGKKNGGRWYVRVGFVEWWLKIRADTKHLVAQWKRLNGAR